MERVLRAVGFRSASVDGKHEARYEPLQLDDLAGSRVSADTAVRVDDDDDDDDGSTPPQQQPPPPSPPFSRSAFAFWIGVNVAATLSIIFANKLVLSSGRLSGSKTLFIAYHFALTGLTLQLAAELKAFPAKAAPVLAILPLALIFAAHTVVTNWSLALLEVVLYQEMRILITPVTVAINFLAYRKTISLPALASLVVVCLGISLTVYADTSQKRALALAAAASAPPASSHSLVRRALEFARNGFVGYLFGIGGVILSAWYTIWMGVYMKRLDVSAMQLLHNLAPLGCTLLLVAVPFLDDLPVWGDVTAHEWTLVAISGLCAVLINVSQFYIVAGSSALSSTVVGHGKTIAIVTVGWITATSVIALESGVGILLALTGIVAYGAVGLRQASSAK